MVEMNLCFGVELFLKGCIDRILQIPSGLVSIALRFILTPSSFFAHLLTAESPILPILTIDPTPPD